MPTVTDQRARAKTAPSTGDSQDYLDVFHWPTTIDAKTGDVRLQVGGLVDAIVIRAGFAAEVNSFLVRHMLQGPIIATPNEPSDWIFLTQPRTAMRLSTCDDLIRLNVGWKRRGDTISLPAPDNNTTTGLRWVALPDSDAELPPWSAVVGAVRTTSNAGRVC